MNRPNWQDCLPKAKYYVKDEYIEQLEKYCDLLEMNADSFLNTIWKLDKEIERLNKALDKASRYLTYDHFCTYEHSTTLSDIVGEMAYWTTEEWKEFLSQDE